MVLIFFVLVLEAYLGEGFGVEKYLFSAGY